MRRYQVALGALAVGAAGIMTSGAKADLVEGASVVVPEDNMTVAVRILRHEAAFEGVLYFAGSGTASSITDFAAGSDLGQLLVNNKRTIAGTLIDIAGVFNAGDVLHFSYDVVDSAKTWHTDRNATQFAYDESTGLLAVEDLEVSDSDFDYNDLEVEIIFVPGGVASPVPAPAALAVLAMGGVMGRRRRRD